MPQLQDVPVDTSPAGAVPSHISQDSLFSQFFNYYHQLQTRKLQYIAALFTAEGVFLVLWKDISATQFAEAFCLAASFTFMVILQMFSRIRSHVHRVSLQVNRVAGETVLEVPASYTLGLQGITFYLYVLTIIFISIWLVIFWDLNVIAAGALALIFVLQLLHLNIVCGCEGDLTAASLIKKLWRRIRWPKPEPSAAAPVRLYAVPDAGAAAAEPVVAVATAVRDRIFKSKFRGSSAL